MSIKWKGMFMNPSVADSIHQAKDAGYDGCGCMLLPRGGASEPKSILMTDPDEWKKVQEALDETGMFLDGIGNCIIDDNDNLHPFGMGKSPDPDAMRPFFEFAGEHHLGGVQTSIWTANEDLALEKFDKLCAVTGEYGLKVNLEFVAWGVCDNLTRAKRILDAVNRPNARITLDLMHMYYNHVTPEEITACPPEIFGEVHICDVPHVEYPTEKEAMAKEGRSFRLFPGETGIDYTPWLKVIPQTAIFMPEIPNKARMSEWGAFEYNRRALQASKEYYETHH